VQPVNAIKKFTMVVQKNYPTRNIDICNWVSHTNIIMHASNCFCRMCRNLNPFYCLDVQSSM